MESWNKNINVISPPWRGWGWVTNLKIVSLSLSNDLTIFSSTFRQAQCDKENRSLIQKILLTFSLLLVSQLTFATNKVTATLDTNAIYIGQKVTLKLYADYSVDSGTVSIKFPDIKSILDKKLEVRSKSKLDTLIPDKAEPTIFRQSQSYTLTSFDTGYYAIPPFQFIINNQLYKTEAMLLTVKSVPVDTTKAIFDIKGPIQEPFSLIDWLKDNWWWILLTIVGITGIIYLIKYLKNRPVKIKEEPIKEVIPADVIAIQKLESLQKDKLWQHGKTKEFHSGVSEILREYIENRYSINALEQTTHEIRAALRFKNIEDQILNKLIETLELADLVKFAKEQPLPNENETSITNAFEFVKSTKQIIEIPKPENV